MNHLPRSLTLSAILVAALLIPLTYTGFSFFQSAAENRMIQTVVEEQVHALNNADLVELSIFHNGEALDMEMTIRTAAALSYSKVLDLQEAIVKELDRPVSIKVNQVFVDRLDSLNPPTATPTATQTSTPTPGPAPLSRTRHRPRPLSRHPAAHGHLAAAAAQSAPHPPARPANLPAAQRSGDWLAARRARIECVVPLTKLWTAWNGWK
jgi:hypothetical protein